MDCLADTNVLVRAVQHSHELHGMALESLKELLRLGGRVRRLVVAHGVSGVQVHDARLVAAMRVYGVRSVLTFNGSDFSRYSEVQVMHPGQVAGLREDRGEH